MLREKKTALNKAQILAAVIMNLAVVVSAIVGAVNNYNQGVGGANSGWSMLVFYTCDSNLLGAIACSILTVCYIRMLKTGKALPGWAVIIKYMAVCCLTITFLVTVFILTPFMAMDARLYGMPEKMSFAQSAQFMLLGGCTLYHHVISPLLAFISFVLFEPLPCGAKKALGYAIIPTAIYAAVSVTLNILRIWHGPYPFLYVYEQSVWMSLVWFAVVFGGAALISFLIAKIRNPLKG